MSELDNYTKEVKPTSLTLDEDIIKDFDIEYIEKFIKDLDYEKYNNFISGKVYQKNKELNLYNCITKLLLDNINVSEDNSTDSTNKNLSKLNKKLVTDNLQNLNTLLNNLPIDNMKIFYSLLGTMIQYIYEFEKR